MDVVSELDSLFEQATGNAPVGNDTARFSLLLPPIKGVATKLTNLINRQLPLFLQDAVTLERLKLSSQQTDGLIIGTGEEDFTQGNTVYTLHYKDKIFQLIDVPGIEGNESKYEEMVKSAIAKAHLVLYVNGTDKKPEQGTAEKIRSYLRRGTQVCPLININYHADQFVDEGVPESLVKSEDKTLSATVHVLEAVLGKEVLLPGHYVQGLIGFSSLAMRAETMQTTIHPSRHYDLAIQQKNYLKHFPSPKVMYEFSQIKDVAQVLHNKLGTFREDIIESNKAKIKELLSDNIHELEKTLHEYHGFMGKTRPIFNECRENIQKELLSFEQLIESGRKNLWSSFFTDLCEEANDIVQKHFGDNDQISSAIERAYKSKQEALGAQFDENFTRSLNTMLNAIETSMVRLIENVQRVELQQRFVNEGFSKDMSFHSTNMDMGFKLKDFGRMAVDFGSYMLSGAAIGSAFPGIGTIIGVAVGAAIGTLKIIIDIFTSKEDRIRKAQAKIQNQIDDVRRQILKNLDKDVRSVVKPVRDSVEVKVLAQLDDLYNNMAKPIEIMEQQIFLMKKMKTQLEKMPYGTVQAI